MFQPPSYVLIMDDDIDDLEMLSTALESSGIKVKSFISGEKGLTYLGLMTGNTELPVFIILDFNMGRINGEQVLSFIKENKDTRHIPVVIYSTGMSLILKRALLDLGAFDCFIKPSSYLEFTAQVEIFKQLALSFLANKKVACK